MKFHVYILWSNALRKTYVGFTSDLNARLLAHNIGNKGWTLRGRPWVLIYSEVFLNKSDAMQREGFFKSGKGRQFINNNILSAF